MYVYKGHNDYMYTFIEVKRSFWEILATMQQAIKSNEKDNTSF